MRTGMQVLRHYLIVTRTGDMVVDWGEGEAQDLMTGEFVPFGDMDIGHPMSDRELDLLIACGRLLGYDARHVYLGVLPESQRRVLD